MFRQSAPHFHSTVVGDLVSRSVEGDDLIVPVREGAGEVHARYSMLDGSGVPWIVHELETPEAWAHAKRCLILNSRECVRRLWDYPGNWRSLDADTLLRLGARAETSP